MSDMLKDRTKRYHTSETAQTMTDVRHEVDRIDRLLVELLVERQSFMDAAARIKGARKAVLDRPRIEDVVAKVKAEAEQQGLSPAIAEPLAFPDLSEEARDKIAEDAWESVGRTAGELPHLPRIDPYDGDRVEVIGAEHLDAIEASDKGAIIAAGHFANWEVMAAVTVQEPFYPKKTGDDEADVRTCVEQITAYIEAETDWQDGERIAKYLARAGIASRREAEAMIERGEVRIDGRKLTTPAFKVTGREDIRVNGKRVQAHEPVRVWRYHKPAGLITTTSDPEGRRTIFDELPKALPRTITIGRLDLTTEGILLLTNDGGLARAMELPKTGFIRHYRARAHGEITQTELDTLKAGVTLDDGTRYTSIEAELERETGTNNWIYVRLTEGKNREVRKAMEHLGLQVDIKVNELLDDMQAKGPVVDMVESFSAELPLFTLCEILGVPDADRPKLVHWMHYLENSQYQAQQEGLGNVSEEQIMEFLNEIQALFDFGRHQLLERRKNPKNDLLSAIANAEIDGEPLSDEFLDGSWLLIVFAGNDTTRNSLSGTMKLLTEHPDQRAKLLANDGMFSNFVNEAIRMVSPVTYMRRTVTKDAELGGQKVSEGDKVVMYYAAANRDPAKFANPNAFDIERANANEHLAFGNGPHVCLGKRVAIMQLETAYRNILRRFPDIRWTGKGSLAPSNFVHAISSLEVDLGI
eukprot:g3313.t1